MKRQTLVNGVLSIVAVALFTGCVDDKYDLTDVDTTSRFIVNDLTVPINLSEIKLENVISLDDNENIDKVVIDGQECYAIVKGGEISSSEFTIDCVHVPQPLINPSEFTVAIPNEVTGAFDIPAIDLPSVPLQDYQFSMQNVDNALEVLRKINSVEPINIEIVLTVPQDLVGVNSNIKFQNLKIQLPWGLITDTPYYDKDSGMLTVAEMPVESDGKARLIIVAFGLDLKDKGVVENGSLSIGGKVGIQVGQIKISVKDVTLPSSIDITADYIVSSFDIASFNGTINYQMDNIDIDPISLNDLPDFLDSPETNIMIANPQILVSINNPVGKYGLDGSGFIKLTSTFKSGETKEYDSNTFSLIGDRSDLAFCTEKNGYSFVGFDGLHNVLSSDGEGLPQSIKVNIQDISFKGDVTDFPLGNIGSADGNYQFEAPLGFGKGSKVIYETTVDGWGSDDLDDVNITKLYLKAFCSTNLPVGVLLSIQPIDKNGNDIPIKEQSSLSVDPKSDKTPVTLSIEAANGTIHGLDGVRFKALISQEDANNTESLGPDLFIKLDDIRVTVDGYYETDF